MDYEKFEEIVRPFLLKLSGGSHIINTELILRDSKPQLTTISERGGDVMNTVSEVNKLLYIPNFAMAGKGYLVFSTESEMYIYYPEGEDTWYEAPTPSGWSTANQWVWRGGSITAMNKGRGWNVSSRDQSNYYILDLNLKRLTYLNWTIVKNPLEMK